MIRQINGRFAAENPTLSYSKHCSDPNSNQSIRWSQQLNGCTIGDNATSIEMYGSSVGQSFIGYNLEPRTWVAKVYLEGFHGRRNPWARALRIVMHQRAAHWTAHFSDSSVVLRTNAIVEQYAPEHMWLIILGNVLNCSTWSRNIVEILGRSADLIEESAPV